MPCRAPSTVLSPRGTDKAQHARWGWSETQPAPDTAALYSAQFAALRTAADQYTPHAPAEPATRGHGNIVAVCGCTGTAARPIRISPTKLPVGPITCGICDQQYRPRDR